MIPRKYIITTDTSVREAMNALNEVSPKIVFITNNGLMLASLTDGDIRRFLLKGGQLTDSALNAANTKPKCAKNREEAASMYHRRNYVAIPIIGENSELLDIYLGENAEDWSESFAALGIPVVVNAGGKGTRLEPYTKILPKPLIPVGDLPIIEHILNRFEKYGCNEHHIIVNYKKELMKAYFADNEKKYNISWYDEEKPLGTGGGLCYLKGKIHQTFFFTSCDNLLLSNYDSMLRFHKESGNLITMICAYKSIKIPYGVIEMGINGSLESMKEKPELSFLTNTGIYIVEPEVLELIEEGVPVGFPDIIVKARNLGEKVSIYPVSGDEWLDMGQIDELNKMRERLYGK